MKRIISLVMVLVSLTCSLTVSAAASEIQNDLGFVKINVYTPGQFSDVSSSEWCAANVQTAYAFGVLCMVMVGLESADSK